MKYILTAVMGAGLAIVVMAALHNRYEHPVRDPVLVGPVYDPNDPIYQLIPLPKPQWVERFGDNERARVLHAISEMRVVIATMGRTIMDLEAKVGMSEDEFEQMISDIEARLDVGN